MAAERLRALRYPERRRVRRDDAGRAAPAVPLLQGRMDRLGDAALRARRRPSARRAERAGARRLHDAEPEAGRLPGGAAGRVRGAARGAHREGEPARAAAAAGRQRDHGAPRRAARPAGRQGARVPPGASARSRAHRPRGRAQAAGRVGRGTGRRPAAARRSPERRKGPGAPGPFRLRHTRTVVREPDYFLVSQKILSISAMASRSFWPCAGSSLFLASPASLVAFQNVSWSCGNFCTWSGLK